MKTTRRHSIVLASVTTLVLAACGGGAAATNGPGGPPSTSTGPATQDPVGAATQAPGNGSETVDACALLTAEDIKDVTGLVAKSIVAGPQGGIFPSGCLWELIDDTAMVPPSISLGVIRPGGRDYYDRYFAALEDPDYEPIDDLGDEAVDAGFGAVLVVSGDTFLQVQYIGGGLGGGDSTALATELARWVVINLGG